MVFIHYQFNAQSCAALAKARPARLQEGCGGAGHGCCLERGVLFLIVGVNRHKYNKLCVLVYEMQGHSRRVRLTSLKLYYSFVPTET